MTGVTFVGLGHLVAKPLTTDAPVLRVLAARPGASFLTSTHKER